jgi:hypothetical protein
MLNFNPSISGIIEKATKSREEVTVQLSEALTLIEERLHEGKVASDECTLLEGKVKILKAENKRLYQDKDYLAEEKKIGDEIIARLMRENEVLRNELRKVQDALKVHEPFRIWTNDGEL